MRGVDLRRYGVALPKSLRWGVWSVRKGCLLQQRWDKELRFVVTNKAMKLAFSSCPYWSIGGADAETVPFTDLHRSYDEGGGGIQSVMSKRRFCLVYLHAMYSRQCAGSYDSGGISRARGILTRGCTKTIVSGKGRSHFWISQSIVGLSSYIMQCVLPFAITIPIKTHHSYYSHSRSLQSLITGGNKPFWEAKFLKSHKAQKSFNSWLLEWHLLHEC